MLMWQQADVAAHLLHCQLGQHRLQVHQQALPQPRRHAEMLCSREQLDCGLQGHGPLAAGRRQLLIHLLIAVRSAAVRIQQKFVWLALEELNEALGCLEAADRLWKADLSRSELWRPG